MTTVDYPRRAGKEPFMRWSVLPLLVLVAMARNSDAAIGRDDKDKINRLELVLDEIDTRMRAAEASAVSTEKIVRATQGNIVATQENVRSAQERLAKLNSDAADLAKRLDKVNERADAIIGLISPETAETVIQNVSMKREILARNDFERKVQQKVDESEKRMAVAESAVESVRSNLITMLFAVIGSLIVGVSTIVGFGIRILKTVSDKQFLVRERPSESQPKRILTN